MALVVIETETPDYLAALLPSFAAGRVLFKGESAERAIRAIARRLDPSLLMRMADAAAVAPEYEIGGEG